MTRQLIRVWTLAASLALAALPAAAQTVEDSIIEQLRAQGYVEFSVEHTLLGRLRIIAHSDTLYREIVLNPTSGEILRDYWRELDDDAPIMQVQIVRTDQDHADDDAAEDDGDGGDADPPDDQGDDATDGQDDNQDGGSDDSDDGSSDDGGSEDDGSEDDGSDDGGDEDGGDDGGADGQTGE